MFILLFQIKCIFFTDDSFLLFSRDPPEVPGLAHFLEHMLFLGTERYPEESAYSNFISTHGGAYNASTDYEFTSFYFSVAAQQLEGALDRFSAFFVCPLFTESCTDREVNAVHQEFEKNLLNDLFRDNRLLYSLIAKHHPLNKFVSGNRETLVDMPSKAGVSLREELFKFYEANYSSHIMCLTVLGKQSLDELQQIVVPRFAPMRRNDAVEPIIFTNPFSEADQLRKVGMFSVIQYEKFQGILYLHNYFLVLKQTLFSIKYL